MSMLKISVVVLATLAMADAGHCAIVLFDQSGPTLLGATSIGQPRDSNRGEAYDDFQLGFDSTVTGFRIWTLEAVDRSGPLEYFIHESDNGLPSISPFAQGFAQSVASVDTGLVGTAGGNQFQTTFELETSVLLNADTVYWIGLVQESVDFNHPTFWAGSDMSFGSTTQRAIFSSGQPAWQPLGSSRDVAFQVLGNATVPEPSSIITLAGLLASFGLFGWWKKRKQAA